MTALTTYDRPGTQRTDHPSHRQTAHSRERCRTCPHHSVRGANPGAPCPPLPDLFSIPPTETPNTLSQQMWQVHADIEAEVSKLDGALRRTWLWLGGVLLPFAGVIVYAMAHMP